MPWNDLSRGADGHWVEGADDNAKAMGMQPLISGTRPEDEASYLRQHGYWAECMRKAIAAERGDAGQAAAVEAAPCV